MIQFINPAALWTLAGLMVPIGIHLLSRKEGKLIRIGSLRHIHETNTQQFKGIRLNELWLLLLRCLVIILFALIVSGMSWTSPGKKKWLLVEKGLENGKVAGHLRDSLEKEGYESRFLAPGFPLLTDTAGVSTPRDYRESISELEKKGLADGIVIARNIPSSFRGLRMALPSNIRWISETSGNTKFALKKIKIPSDSLEVRQGYSNEFETTFDYARISGTGAAGGLPKPVIKVWLTYDEHHEYDRQIVHAALSAIENSMSVIIDIKEMTTETTPSAGMDWYLWLADAKFPIASPGSGLIYSDKTFVQGVIRQTAARQWALHDKLDEETALEENLAITLAGILMPEEIGMKEIVSQHDRRLVPDAMAWSSGRSAKVTDSISDAGYSFLLPLLIILIFVERLIALKRNQ